MLEKGNGRMQVMSVMEQLEFQEYFEHCCTADCVTRVHVLHIFPAHKHDSTRSPFFRQTKERFHSETEQNRVNSMKFNF